MQTWSNTVTACQHCFRTDRRHMAKGLCGYCYLRQYQNDPKNAEKIREAKRKHYAVLGKCQTQPKREARHFDGNRQAVLLRDKHKCVHCHNAGNIVHHIDGNGRGSKRPNNSLDNLVTLCRACHINAHRQELVDSKFKPGVDGWAKKFAQCLLCARTDSEHNSRGRCARCMAKVRREAKI